jgi:predicted nucleic acid-binding Zn ribbon protein
MLCQHCRQPLKECPVCGSPFKPHRSDQVYCTRNCTIYAAIVLSTTRRRVKSNENIPFNQRILSGDTRTAEEYLDALVAKQRKKTKPLRDLVTKRLAGSVTVRRKGTLAVLDANTGKFADSPMSEESGPLRG